MAGYIPPAGISAADATAQFVDVAGDTMTGALAHGAAIVRHTESGITASTTQTQGEQLLTAEINEVAVVANANDVVTMTPAQPGLKILVINSGANSMQIFPSSGDDLGAGVDTAVALAPGARLQFAAYSATTWVSLV